MTEKEIHIKAPTGYEMTKFERGSPEPYEQDRNGNGLSYSGPWGKIKATGVVGIMLGLTLLLVFVIYKGEERNGIEHRMMMDSHSRIIEQAGDLFLAAVLSEDQKRHLPAIIQEKVDLIILEKARRSAEKNLN